MTGVFGDARFERVIGFEITGADGSQNFLPWVAASFEDGVVSASSRLVPFDEGEVGSYARRGPTSCRTRRSSSS